MKVPRIGNFINNVNFNGSVSQDSDVIKSALKELEKISFETNDLAYVDAIGAKPPFKNGSEALNFIKDNNIKIDYTPFELDDIHAYYSFEDNTIYINKKYENLSDFPGILMISEAIFHEAGHAKDKDEKSSLQEELDCLSLNVLSHVFYTKKYKDVFQSQTTPLFLDGVGKYKDLFFEFDVKKTGLKNRIKEKYGFLPLESPGHIASDFVREIKSG